MAFVRAKGIQRPNPEDSDYPAKDVCLLEIKFEQFLGTSFDEIN